MSSVKTMTSWGWIWPWGASCKTKTVNTTHYNQQMQNINFFTNYCINTKFWSKFIIWKKFRTAMIISKKWDCHYFDPYIDTLFQYLFFHDYNVFNCKYLDLHQKWPRPGQKSLEKFIKQNQVKFSKHVRWGVINDEYHWSLPWLGIGNSSFMILSIGGLLFKWIYWFWKKNYSKESFMTNYFINYSTSFSKKSLFKTQNNYWI